MRILYLPDKRSQQRQFEKMVYVYPVLMAMQATQDRNNPDNHVDWENGDGGDYDKIVTAPDRRPFLSLPIPDRTFTNALDKRYQVYGNYKYHPATHMQVANGCWWGKCSFCVENGREYELRSVGDVLAEIGACEKLGIKEIFDDSGSFPGGGWLEDFCFWKKLMYKDIIIGCNTRISGKYDYESMKKANFRMLLYGVESANQQTLDKINKGINSIEIIPTIRKASQCGLEPHIAVMFGYPWETLEMEINTLKMVHFLLKKGYAKTAQASLYTVNGQSNIDRGLVKKIYDVGFSPEFWINKIKDIRTIEDFLYLIKGIKKGIFRD